jgi:hypothetical protein
MPQHYLAQNIENDVDGCTLQLHAMLSRKSQHCMHAYCEMLSVWALRATGPGPSFHDKMDFKMHDTAFSDRSSCICASV